MIVSVDKSVRVLLNVLMNVLPDTNVVTDIAMKYVSQMNAVIGVTVNVTQIYATNAVKIQKIVVTENVIRLVRLVLHAIGSIVYASVMNKNVQKDMRGLLIPFVNVSRFVPIVIVVRRKPALVLPDLSVVIAGVTRSVQTG